ncbi:MAG: hypothetical protein V3U84_10775 [Thiotrichaceae bacterium]
MSGTNYPTGLATRKKFGGSAVDFRNAADTKFISKTAVIRCDAQTTETQTEFTLPATAIVRDVFLNVITVDATETVDVGTQGTSNDPNGYLAAASLATAGLVYGSLADGAVTRGALLFEITEATTAAARMPDITAGGDPVSYTCSAGSDTAVFDIIIDYIEVVSEAS